MPHLEESMGSRETFDKAEEGITQKKQEIAEAVAAGDYERVAALAQEAKGMEAEKGEMKDVTAHGEAIEHNNAFDETKAAEERLQRDAEFAEQARQQEEKDSQEAAEVLARLQGGDVGKIEEGTEAPKNLESLQNENRELQTEAKTQGKQYMGEAKFALAEKNLSKFQEIYSKLIETRIRTNELQVARLDMDFEGGNFQNRGPSTSPEVKEIYEYQKESQLNGIRQMKESVLHFEQLFSKGSLPNEPGFQDAFEQSKPAQLLRDLRIEAAKFQDLEEKLDEGQSYGDYTAELEGAVASALDSRDAEVQETLKYIARTIKKLSPELKQKIESRTAF